MESAKLRIYKGGDSKRPIEKIPPQEISLAVLECVRNSISITEDDLVREIARLFGLRATKKVAPIIRRIIRSMVSNKSLRRKSGKIMIGKTK
jgi:hypothetical protein